MKLKSARSSSSTRAAAGMLLDVPPRFSLKETVLSHGWHQLAPFRWDATTSSLWRVESLPGRRAPLVLRIRQTGGIGRPLHARILHGRLEGSERGLLRSRLARMLSLDLDLSGFYRLCRGESLLRYVPRVGAGRFLSSGSLYEDVFKTICGTNISWKQAVRAVNRIVDLGEPATGRGFRAFPTPERILACGRDRLSKVSRLGYRVPYLMSWAERASSPDPSWVAAEEGMLAEGELREFLLSIRGIGRTSCRYLMMMRGLAGEIPVDSSVLLFLRETRFRIRNPSPAEIARIYDRFGGWKAYAYWFEFLPWARKHWALDEEGSRPSEGE